jgi:hypothetical protein
MSQKEWRYQMKPFKPLLKKRGSATTKEYNAYSKHPRKKRRGLLRDTECKSIEVNKHRVDVE